MVASARHSSYSPGRSLGRVASRIKRRLNGSALSQVHSGPHRFGTYAGRVSVGPISKFRSQRIWDLQRGGPHVGPISKWDLFPGRGTVDSNRDSA